MILDKRRGLVAMITVLALLGCGRGATNPPKSSAPAGPLVVATTSTLVAIEKLAGGDLVEVSSLVPVGVSPETYEPTPQDVVALHRASLIVENGSGLETWLTKLIANSSTHARVLVLSAAIIGPQANNPASARNPHFWLDPTYAQIYVKEIATALGQADPVHAAAYQENADAAAKRLTALDSWIKSRIATIPPQNRAMIAFHDAWYYFDRRYGIRDVGAIESSPGKDPGAGELAALIAAAKREHVRAIFAEPEFSPKLAKQLAEDAGIKTVTDLYDDSLGNSPELSTYEGLMRHNVDTIVEALK